MHMISPVSGGKVHREDWLFLAQPDIFPICREQFRANLRYVLYLFHRNSVENEEDILNKISFWTLAKVDVWGEKNVEDQESIDFF